MEITTLVVGAIIGVFIGGILVCPEEKTRKICFQGSERCSRRITEYP